LRRLEIALLTYLGPTCLETIVCKFDRDPVICLREEAMYMYIIYIVTNRLQYFARVYLKSAKMNRIAFAPRI